MNKLDCRNKPEASSQTAGTNQKLQTRLQEQTRNFKPDCRNKQRLQTRLQEQTRSFKLRTKHKLQTRLREQARSFKPVCRNKLEASSLCFVCLLLFTATTSALVLCMRRCQKQLSTC